MNIKYCSDYDQMSHLACNSIITSLNSSSKQLICTATGASPIGVYEKLAHYHNAQPEFFKATTIVQLDEWVGLSTNDPSSCESFIRTKILQPLHIADDRFISFHGNTAFPEKECERVDRKIDDNGPIDICILGLGKNGHIGFNEPAETLSVNSHLAKLSPASRGHQMTNTMQEKPSYGLTLGMANILKSKKIILLITGSDKEKIVKQFLGANITTHLPASFLWLHSNVECYIDSEVYPKLI